jgi:hypothetical protein
MSHPCFDVTTPQLENRDWRLVAAEGYDGRNPGGQMVVQGVAEGVDYVEECLGGES